MRALPFLLLLALACGCLGSSATRPASIAEQVQLDADDANDRFVLSAAPRLMWTDFELVSSEATLLVAPSEAPSTYSTKLVLDQPSTWKRMATPSESVESGDYFAFCGRSSSNQENADLTNATVSIRLASERNVVHAWRFETIAACT